MQKKIYIIVTALVFCTTYFSSSAHKIQVISGKHAEVFNIVKNYLPKSPIILEAGAFDGIDTERMKNIWPDSIIFSFEPDPENFIKLQNKTKNLHNVFISTLALSNTNGHAIFYRSQDRNTPDNRQSGSLLAPKEHLAYAPHVVFSNEFEVSTTTIDDWAKSQGINHIDFLWLDMQGAELLALKAGQNILKTVSAIFTEVEFVEAYQGQALSGEIQHWLEKQGFTLIAQDFPLEKNNKWYGNILMVRLPTHKEL